MVKGEKALEAQWPDFKSWISVRVGEGRHILLLHHDNKSGDQYGDSLKEMDFDCWMQLKKKPQYDEEGRYAVELSFSKPRHLSVEDAAPNNRHHQHRG